MSHGEEGQPGGSMWGCPTKKYTVLRVKRVWIRKRVGNPRNKEIREKTPHERGREGGRGNEEY